MICSKTIEIPVWSTKKLGPIYDTSTKQIQQVKDSPFMWQHRLLFSIRKVKEIFEQNLVYLVQYAKLLLQNRPVVRFSA